jgi:hypothetical protein
MPGEKTWAQVWAEREQLRIENETLKAENADLRSRFEVELSQQVDMSTRELRAEVAQAEVHVGRLVTQLTELREAAERVREAMKRDSYTTDDKGKRVPDAFRHFPEVIALDAVLAKVKA